jgi:hypothetical protein
VALHHTKMAREPIVLQAAVSFTVESALGRSPDEIFRVGVVGEMVVEFKRLEEWCSRLERPAVRICDLLLGPPPGWAQLADRQNEVTRKLRVVLAARQEADAELEVLQTLAA